MGLNIVGNAGRNGLAIAAAVGAGGNRQSQNWGDRNRRSQGLNAVTIGVIDRRTGAGNDEKMHLAQEPIGLVPSGNLVQ